ncbi:PREDICTED: organic cation transporter protein-like isoform X1 [Papilio xuthus]|uniref:Organic cation transporter protein-like isoform X1 n=1 Tax=Papilio xuthus TaxID=66420 RepID=A0AAJ6ZIQ7_PAPXU|nr:PREDICTED: organic cation transporter protein-like isoform X1 [Papilio xuthus]
MIHNIYVGSVCQERLGSSRIDKETYNQSADPSVSYHRVKVLDRDNKDAESQKITEDPITKAIGAIGKWQIWICFVIFLVKFPVAWHQMSIIFLAPPMNFTCASSDNDFGSVCLAEYKNCTDFQYDRSVFHETIISQWNLVCNREWLKSLTQTIFMLGILVGNMVFGHLSDRFGRRMPFVAAVCLQLVTGVTTAFSVDWYMFTILRFLLAVATGGTMVSSFVLIMEIIGAKYRETVGILYQIPFNLGHLTLPLFGYFLRDWNTFQLAISLPSVLFLSYYFLLPESPRWLITSGKAKEAAVIMETAAKRNGLPTDEIATTTQKIAAGLSNADEEHASFLALFRTPKLRARTIAICFNWFVCGLCFFGVSQYIGHVSGDIFSNVAVSAAIQVPGTLISIYANRVLGRKVTLISANCVTGLSCLLIMVVPDTGASHLSLGCIGLWGMSISFATVYLYAGELFPTVVRNSGVGLASTVARIGSMVAPFVATLRLTYFWLPPLAFGIVPLIGAGLCLVLPDTRGKKLPDTLDEGEA